MTILRSTALLCPLGLLTVLAACGASRGPDHVTPCMFEVNAPGAYEYPAGVAVPTVVPGSGATQEGADAINACVRERAGAAQTPVPTGGSSLQQTMTTQASGGVVTRTYTYGTAPAAQSVAPVVTSAATANGAAPAQCQRLEMRGGSGFACVQ